MRHYIILPISFFMSAYLWQILRDTPDWAAAFERGYFSSMAAVTTLIYLGLVSRVEKFTDNNP